MLALVKEAMVVELRRRTLLPLDDVLGCLRDSIPKLTRSSLHRTSLPKENKDRGADLAGKIVVKGGLDVLTFNTLEDTFCYRKVKRVVLK